MQVYGIPMKQVAQEEFGDGIMSAIDFLYRCGTRTRSQGRSRQDYVQREILALQEILRSWALSSTSELRLMLVDQSTQRRDILEKVLRENGYANVFATSGLSDVYELVLQVKPDVVLIELDSPSRDTLEQLRAIRSKQPTPVLMFAQDQDAQTVNAAVESGVCAYMVDGFDSDSIGPAIALAMATFNAYRRLRLEADGYRRELDSRRLVDQAKALLVKNEGLSEQDAYRCLRKMAMDQNRKLGLIAKNVISKYRNGQGLT